MWLFFFVCRRKDIGSFGEIPAEANKKFEKFVFF